jgi:hypothetical protein
MSTSYRAAVVVALCMFIPAHVYPQARVDYRPTLEIPTERGLG